MNTEKQSMHVAKNIGLLIRGKELVRYSVGEKGICPSYPFTNQPC